MKKFPSGTWVEQRIYESRAFLSLTGIGAQLLILFLARRQFRRVLSNGKQDRVCVNEDSLTFSYIEAEKKYGITKPRFARGIDELMAKGFLKIKRHGGGYQQDKTVYELSHQWVFWQPGTVFERRPKETVGRGFCKPAQKRGAHVRLVS